MEKYTIKDIAREAGVSVGLVSMTLNGKSGVNPKTAEAIMKVVKRLNYTPNKTASAQDTKRPSESSHPICQTIISR